MSSDGVLLVEIYQALYGFNVTQANLNDLVQDLSQVAQRSHPWAGKYIV